MVKNTKECGLMTFRMDLVYNLIKTNGNMKEILKMVKRTGKEKFHGKMESFMMVNGKMIILKEMEY